MARISPKKPARKGAGKKTGQRLGLFALFLFVAATLVAGLYFMVLYPDAPAKIPAPQLSGQAQKTPLPQTGEALPPKVPPPAAAQSKAGRPLLAIIIDDMGYQQNTGQALLALDLPLSFAFLPFTPFSVELQKEAQARGRDILLHLPLEPIDPKWNPGPGALTIAMNPETMKSIFQEDLRAVPKAIGVSNHMGSRFTAHSQAMRTLLSLVRARGLFFLDSVTSAETVAGDLAREMGVKTERRTVFLDNDQEPEKILIQLNLLVQLADKHGQAVGIGHPYPATLEALRRYQTELHTRTEMVGVSRLVH
ncbi:MAG: hypothetical protein A2505_05380 [Deltaproteobacteria bacterium RIFOXYD12_FULL_55_16]|nr:MAG: hypothetical protein A2505_05380 [Deltaproteobacteria bacterium RIFOXYD12_FULL_55_16]